MGRPLSACLPVHPSFCLSGLLVRLGLSPLSSTLTLAPPPCPLPSRPLRSRPHSATPARRRRPRRRRRAAPSRCCSPRCLPRPSGAWRCALLAGRLLAARCWLLAAGCSLLAARCSLLAARCWLLASLGPFLRVVCLLLCCLPLAHPLQPTASLSHQLACLPHHPLAPPRFSKRAGRRRPHQQRHDGDGRLPAREPPVGRRRRRQPRGPLLARAAPQPRQQRGQQPGRRWRRERRWWERRRWRHIRWE